MRENDYRGKHHYSPQTLNEAERQCDIDLWLQSFACPRAQFLTNFACASFFEASCLLEIDTAETSDGTVPATRSLCSRPPLCRESLVLVILRVLFAIVMFSASFVAITTSLKFQTFISSVVHSRPFVPCSSAATRRVGRVQVRRKPNFATILRMRPLSMPESGSWDHSLLVVGGQE